MGMGANSSLGAQFQQSLPPANPYLEGFAAGMSRGMPSGATNWFGAGSRQTPRRGGLPWNNRARGSKRSAKKTVKKDEKKGEEEKEKEKKEAEKKKKEKEKDVLAAEPSGVQKLGKNHGRNCRRREKLSMRK